MSENEFAKGVYLVEGIVEQDPMSDRFVLHTESEGRPIIFDPQPVLAQFKGQEVRVIIAPLATIEQLMQLQAQQEAAEAAAVEAPQPKVEGEKIELSATLVGRKPS